MKYFIQIRFILLFILLLLAYSTEASAFENIYKYDSNGKLITVIEENGAVNYQYDANGNLVKKEKTNNLVNNPDFEVEGETDSLADGWDYWKSNPDMATGMAVVNTPVASGTKAQKIASSAMPAGEAIFVLQDLA
ncbi:RHS repeat domain-containing protein, partial [Paenibacillus periandrae]|uniref:RHS repeat domain-containing protein n=1 Tax=Paenibacillus periandrae TaxID=1761741 RepID=UPI001F089FE8